LLSVTRVRVAEAVLRVLHLHLGEVRLGRAVEGHAAARVEPEIVRVGHADEAEALPVGIVWAVALLRGEEPLGRRVRAHHERDLREAREDARAGHVDGLRARGARAVAARDARALE